MQVADSWSLSDPEKKVMAFSLQVVLQQHDEVKRPQLSSPECE